MRLCRAAERLIACVAHVLDVHCFADLINGRVHLVLCEPLLNTSCDDVVEESLTVLGGEADAIECVYTDSTCRLVDLDLLELPVLPIFTR